jgi:hypothetical protein
MQTESESLPIPSRVVSKHESHIRIGVTARGAKHTLPAFSRLSSARDISVSAARDVPARIVCH